MHECFGGALVRLRAATPSGWCSAQKGDDQGEEEEVRDRLN
jgi:hypothetical protein